MTYSCNRTALCGCSRINAVLNKIVGGESAVGASWGWAVSLQRKLNNEHFCGGAVISALHVLTAAHCVRNSEDIIQNVRAVVGIDQLSIRPPSTTQERAIARVFVHAQYNRNSHVNDIAILQLSEPLNIAPAIGAPRLCLPHVILSSTADNYPIPHSTLVAIGWGRLRAGDQSIPKDQRLQQVSLNEIPYEHRMCNAIINHRQLQFCAGVIGGGKDTCQGDSGGPLMHFDANERRWILVGITSYGASCANPDYAGVYTRVSVYRDWIRSIISDGFIEVTVNGTSVASINSAHSGFAVYNLLTYGLFTTIKLSFYM